MINMKAATTVLLLWACAAALVSARQLQQAGNAAVLTLEFDNSKREVNAKMSAIMGALAIHVFKVPVANVKLEGIIDQSGLVTDQAVATFRATGPTTNGRTVLANCQQNVREDLLGLGSSVVQREIEKATDTWRPNDSIDVEEASCNAA